MTKARLRILMTAGTFPADPEDGSPRFIWDLARALGRRAEVTVLTPHLPGTPMREVWDGVQIARFPYFVPSRFQRLAGGHGMPDNVRASWLARAQVPTLLVAEAIATRRLIQRWRPDVVNAHWLVPQGVTAAWALGSKPRIPLVIHAHGGDAFLLGRLPAGRRLGRYIVDRAGAVLAAGSGLRSELQRLLGSETAVELQPMGVDLARFDLPAPEPDLGGGDCPGGYVLFVGRLTDVKGVHRLVQAFEQVRVRHPRLVLAVAGEGPERSRIETEVVRRGLGQAVRLLGRRSGSEVTSLLQHCRVIAVPSIVRADGRTEGTPTVVVEGLASGARIVATRVGGIPDVLREGETGWLCRPDDPDDLARALMEALESDASPQERARLRKAAEPFGWDAIAERYLDVFARARQARS